MTHVIGGWRGGLGGGLLSSAKSITAVGCASALDASASRAACARAAGGRWAVVSGRAAHLAGLGKVSLGDTLAPVQGEAKAMQAVG